MQTNHFFPKKGPFSLLEISKQINSENSNLKNDECKIYDISSFTGAGIQRLLNEIYNKTVKKTEETPVLSRERHIKIMKNILEILSDLEFKGNLDIAAFEYRAALNLCMEINQKFDIEKILDIIFRDFCIGK